MLGLITPARAGQSFTRLVPTLTTRKMSTQPKVIGKLYMYPSPYRRACEGKSQELITWLGHSRWNRLQAIAAAANVALEPVQNFSVMKAMKDPGMAEARHLLTQY
jgi:hypothetical protein